MKTLYRQKDLGYERKPTSAMLVVTMPDGEDYSVPVQAIADSRDEYCREDKEYPYKEDTIGLIRGKELRDSVIEWWARDHMNWDEVSKYAVRLPRKPPLLDFQQAWVKGDKRIDGSI